jgi:hypothetical protein
MLNLERAVVQESDTELLKSGLIAGPFPPLYEAVSFVFPGFSFFFYVIGRHEDQHSFTELSLIVEPRDAEPLVGEVRNQ